MEKGLNTSVRLTVDPNSYRLERSSERQSYRDHARMQPRQQRVNVFDCRAMDGMQPQNVLGTTPLNTPLRYNCNKCGATLTRCASPQSARPTAE
jgi:hypothetical protein